MSDPIQIIDRGDPHKYYFQIPNMIDEIELDPLAFRLYCHFKKVAGDIGSCWQSIETISKICKMSAGSISNARKVLVAKGLICIENKSRPGGGYPWQVIYIIDIWPQNIARYEKTEQVSPGESQPTPHENQPTPHETKNNPIKNNPIKKVALASSIDG